MHHQFINQLHLACDIELYSSRIRLGKGLDSETTVVQQIVSLRRSWRDEDVEVIVGQHRAHRMEARSAVLPYGREKGQPYAKLKEQRAARFGQFRLGSGELLPCYHSITSRLTTRRFSGGAPR